MRLKVRKESNSEVQKLRTEVAALRSFVIGVAGRDPEGAYRPEFVQRLRRSEEEPIVAQFKNAKQFLALLDDKD